jgi:hypothetical protein
VAEVTDQEMDFGKLLAVGGDVDAFLSALPEGTGAKLLDRAITRAFDGIVRERLQREQAARGWRQPDPSDYGSLEELLERPIIAEPHLIESMQGRKHNASLVGQYKVGKTTLLGTYVRSLVDDDVFLGRATFLPAGRNVGWLNFEMDQDDLLAYLRPLGIQRTDRLHVQNLRGRKLPLMSDHAYDWVKQWLVDNEAAVLLVDSWRRLCGSSGFDENRNWEVEQLTARIDQLKQEAGVDASLITAHTPRERLPEGEERARGGASLDDWVDARWVLTRQNGTRFLAVEGRQIPAREHALAFDAGTNQVTTLGGSRRERKKQDGVQAVVDILLGAQLAGETPLTQSALKERLRAAAGISHNEGDLKSYIGTALAEGLIERETGANRAHAYRPAAGESSVEMTQ